MGYMHTQTHLYDETGRGAPVPQVVSSHKGPKKAIKITHLGINIKVI